MKPIRIFLSYARGDDPPDQTFVRRLHDDLTAAGFTVWFDRESLMSRGLTFHQEIKDAIRTDVGPDGLCRRPQGGAIGLCARGIAVGSGHRQTGEFWTFHDGVNTSFALLSEIGLGRFRFGVSMALSFSGR